MQNLPDNFCVLILTHGRAHKVHTVKTLEKAGYTGKVYIVIDDTDPQAELYRETFGDKVLQFSKEGIAKTFDEADNFYDRRAIVYARNASFELARSVGCRYFMQLDDDYTSFHYRFKDDMEYYAAPVRSLDQMLAALLEYFISIPALSLCIGQGGDFIGGSQGKMASALQLSRKAMNTFICDTERPFQFLGRVNEDVNTYTQLQRAGELFFTYMGASIVQQQTQASTGGMSELYLDSGTYIKSFYSVMYTPSAVKISDMGASNRRIHHNVTWNATAAKVIDQKYRKVQHG